MYLERLNILYAPVPKCACSTMKAFCVHLEYGEPFRKSPLGRTGRKLHHAVKTLPFDKLRKEAPAGAWKFAVVRHPVDRIISCYENKVLQKRLLDEVAQKQLDTFGLSRAPSLADFVQRLPEYKKVSRRIWKHALPLSYFLGSDPAYFDRIYQMQELPEAMDALNARAGRAVPALRRNTAKVRVAAEEITPAVCDQIMEQYRSDIEIFGPALGPSKYATAQAAAE